MFNRSQIMKDAWAIFREAYNYPSTPFLSIGRHCFAWALKEAWRRARLWFAVKPPVTREAACVELALLENKGHWTRADHSRASGLRRVAA